MMIDDANAMKLPDIFSSKRGQRWFFVRPGGNWGDHLIYRGAEQLANRLGLTWRDIEANELASVRFKRTDCIYLHGGGGFNSWCSGRPFKALSLAVALPVELVVQGPQTVEDDRRFLVKKLFPSVRQMDCAKLMLFAREHTSHALLSSILERSPGCTIAVDDDTALHLTRSKLLDLSDTDLSETPTGRYHLEVRREDGESAVLPSSSRSSLFSVAMDPAYYAKSFEHWVRIHLMAKSVTTDRLHSAIVSAILGKDVTLLPGSYHKNRSVYEYTLRNMGVQWRAIASTAQSGNAPRTNALLHRLSNSYKLKRLKYFLAGVPS